MNLLEFLSKVTITEYDHSLDVWCPIDDCSFKLFNTYYGTLALGDIIDVAHKHFRKEHDGDNNPAPESRKDNEANRMGKEGRED
jgi:hypothetical protein